MHRLRIAVLISGGGSNLQAIFDAEKKGDLPIEIACVISNRREAFGLKRALDAGVESIYIGKGNYIDDTSRDEALLQALVSHEVDLVVLAGYLAILPHIVVEAFANRIINIHPALIPRHCGPGYYGLYVHESVIRCKDQISGATTHFVDEGVDTGRIIYQEQLDVLCDDTAESLAQRVLIIEHQLLVKTIHDIANGVVKIGN